MNRRLAIPISMVGLFSTACSSPPEDIIREGFQLVWQDEFDATEGSPPNAEFWSYDLGGDGWGNNQLEYNTDEIENVFMTGDGYLHIVAREESYEDNYYTSGRIQTRDKMAFGLGRMEASIQVPRGAGLWPAFWMLGVEYPALSWPNCGEVDILEFNGGQPGTVYGTVHGPGYSGGAGIGSSYSLFGGTFDTEHHVYAVERDEGHIAWYVDDELYYRLTPNDLPSGKQWVFDGDFFIILNLAVGGHFVQPPDPSTEFPATLSVDYVRYFKRDNSP